MPSLHFKPQNSKGLTIAEAIAKCKSPSLEPKYDGWRFVVYVTDEGVHIYSRTGIEYTGACPQPILDELSRLPVGTVLDGEMVDLADQECTAVTNVFGKSKTPPTQEELDRISYVVFDVVMRDGQNVITNPARERRLEYVELLENVGGERVVPTSQTPIESVEHAEAMYEVLISTGYEGAMIKDTEARYAPGKRGHGWFKIKEVSSIDCVVMDFEADGKGQHLGKVGRFVVGQYRDGALAERAKVNPRDQTMRDAMTAALEVPPEANPFYGRVCEIKIYGELKDGVRHPVHLRWREDKLATDCEWDKP